MEIKVNFLTLKVNYLNFKKSLFLHEFNGEKKVNNMALTFYSFIA